jgi:heat shock protein HslJ
MLVSLEGEAPLPGTQITLRFEDEFLGGTMGCNGYGGSPDTGEYLARKGRLTVVPPFAVTVQLCSEPEGIMEQEQAYISALLSAASYRVAGGRLEIADGDGNTVLVFDRAP